MKKKILILGGGISGAYLAYKLKKAGFSIKLLEANKHLGGRIYTKNIGNTRVDLGATWLWRYNAALLKLCTELHISLFPQNMEGAALFQAAKASVPVSFNPPHDQEISYRIVGGTKTILDKLTTHLTADEVQLQQKILKIENNKTTLQVRTEKEIFIADIVISTIPPRLLVNSVKLPSELNPKLIEIANNTHTWMAETIKFAVIYKTAFWRNKKLSGAGFSNTGPFTEIYDHSNFKTDEFALMGFLKGSLASETKQYREQQVRQQLLQFFGELAKNYTSYQEKIWSDETLIHCKNNTVLSAHYKNGHSIYQEKFLEGKLILAGSETSPQYGGYMEGAIYIANQIIAELEST
jgi:monoamine oxidase